MRSALSVALLAVPRRGASRRTRRSAAWSTAPKFKQAAAFIQADQDRFVRELVTLTEIPAPPFKEQARGEAFMEMLRQQGLSDVEMDAEGNVMGIRRGTGPAGGACWS